MRAYVRMRACKSARTHLQGKSNFKLLETTFRPFFFLFFLFFPFPYVVERKWWTYSLKGEKPDQITHSLRIRTNSMNSVGSSLHSLNNRLLKHFS